MQPLPDSDGLELKCYLRVTSLLLHSVMSGPGPSLGLGFSLPFPLMFLLSLPLRSCLSTSFISSPDQSWKVYVNMDWSSTLGCSQIIRPFTIKLNQDILTILTIFSHFSFKVVWWFSFHLAASSGQHLDFGLWSNNLCKCKIANIRMLTGKAKMTYRNLIQPLLSAQL